MTLARKEGRHAAHPRARGKGGLERQEHGQTTIPRPIRPALKLSPTYKVRFSRRGDDTVVITRVSTEQRDPMVAAFLVFIDADARQHPQRVRAIAVDVIDRARELSAGVEVHLDAPLDADEG